MNRDSRSSSNDPTAERTSSQSTQTASGLSGGRQNDGDNVKGADLETPRRYEQPLEEDDDPVMPSHDSTANTKI
jgi:hypothetical protein